jgi:AMP-binding enzyme C-terminal domain
MTVAMSEASDDFAGRWQAKVVLKRDVFSTVERGIYRGDDGEEPAVLRRLDEVPWWSRPLANLLFRRERRALGAATLLGVSPPLLYADATRLVRGYIPGSALKIVQPFGDRAYFRSARAALRKLHRAHITHNDLAKEQNWLVGADGNAYLIDFQLAAVFTRRSWLFRMAAYEDLRHFLKHKRRYVPAALTAAEKRVLARKSLPNRVWMATGKKIYLLITRGVFGFIDAEGGGTRLAHDAPAIEAALKRFAHVRDAAVLDFPDRKSGTGLYAFVEADTLLADDVIFRELARAIGAGKLPEFVQIVRALPRRRDGSVRRDILRLISTNQVDLMGPLIESADERGLVDQIVAARKNLYGAPEVAAALCAHRGVRDAVVVACPDKLTGTSLYAFVEMAGTPADSRAPRLGATDTAPTGLSEADLLTFAANAVGRDNAPKYIQVVEALPRTAAGEVRTEILQLIATNRVDGIEPLITSEVERAMVQRILDSRQNTHDRFML